MGLFLLGFSGPSMSSQPTDLLQISSPAITIQFVVVNICMYVCIIHGGYPTLIVVSSPLLEFKIRKRLPRGLLKNLDNNIHH